MDFRSRTVYYFSVCVCPPGRGAASSAQSQACQSRGFHGLASCAADLRTLAKLIPAESRLVIEPARAADNTPKALEVVSAPTSSIRQGDVLRVLPGERVPVDGEILDGRCALDESMLTGESALVNKAEGSQASPTLISRKHPADHSRSWSFGRN